VDNDCDGEIDEACPCDPGQTQPCYSGDPATLGVGECLAGVQVCGAQGFGACEGEILPAEEQCNAFDDDCDGEVDDGFGEQSCGVGACAVTMPVCLGGVLADCVPNQPGVEVCDGFDNDCDGATDESDPVVGLSCTTGLPGACATGTWACL